MADIIKGLFGSPAKPSAAAPAPAPADADFAEFAAEPSPAAAPSLSSAPAAQQTFGSYVPIQQRPFTKWYRVWERTSIEDFYGELMVLPFILLLVVAHAWGARRNKNKAKGWIRDHASTLSSEFAVVGFKAPPKRSIEDADAPAPAPVLDPEQLIKEKAKDLYLSYASGRQNVAFVDIKYQLAKRYNPLLQLAEYGISFVSESYPASTDRVEITAYAFDGKEASVVPQHPGQEFDKKGTNSTYEGFVWAVVHKDKMRRLREDRYDLSLTVTKENAKLPDWATVMSESAEVTDLLLTNNLVKAITDLGDDFESLIITDLPVDAPKTLDDLVPKKRLQLTTKFDADVAASNALLSSFIRLPDALVGSSKLRPEVVRRLRATRDDAGKKLRRAEEQEKAEERKLNADKARKEERDKKLKGMSAEEQRKFLEKERDRDQKKSMGKRTMRA